jgi:hypothetical protein
MCNDNIIRRFAGVFIIASLLLGWFVNSAWFVFTAFVGVNLLQSSFTDMCPLERILGRFKILGCDRRDAAAGHVPSAPK